MKKNFKDGNEMRTFLTEHVFYYSTFSEPLIMFNKGFFGKLPVGDAKRLTPSDIRKEKQKLKQPYSIGKQLDKFVLIDGSKSLNGSDYAYEIEIDVTTDLSVPLLSNNIPRYKMNLISEVSHKTIVSLFSR